MRSGRRSKLFVRSIGFHREIQSFTGFYWVLFFPLFLCASGAVGVFFYFAGEIFLLVVVTKKKTRHSADRILRVVILIFVSIFLLFRK